MSRIIIFGASPLPIENEKIISGPGIRTWQFTKSLLDDNHKIRLLCLKDNSAYFKNNQGHFKETSNLEYYSLPEDKFRDMRFMYRLADNYKPDCIISISSLLVSKISAALNIPKPIWFDRGDLMAEAQLKSYNDQNDTLPKEFSKFEKHILSRGDVFSSVSFPQKCSVIGRLGGAGRLTRLTLGYEFVHVIPCGIEKEAYQKKKTMLRGKIVENDDLVVLWSGGYNTWADVDTLFNGLEAAISKNEKIKFVSTGGSIAGHDDFTYKRFLDLIAKSKYKKNFIMLDWLPFHDLPDIYSESDLGVNIDKNCYETLLGSRHRLLEWMKGGLPFVTTTPSEFTQFLCNKQLAFPFESGNANSLSSTIQKLSENRNILKNCSSRIKSFVIDHYLYQDTTLSLQRWAKEPKFAPDKFSIDEKLNKKVLKIMVDDFDTINFREIEKQLSDTKAQNTELTKHISNLEQIRTELTKHIDYLNEELKKLRLQAIDLEAEKKQITKQLSISIKQEEKPNKELAELKEDNNQTKNELSNCKEELNRIHKTLIYRIYSKTKNIFSNFIKTTKVS